MTPSNLGNLAFGLQNERDLEAALDLVGAALKQVFLEDGQRQEALLRLVVHIRDRDAYSNLHCLSWNEEDTTQIELGSSSALWERLSESIAPTILDISIGEIAQLSDCGIQIAEMHGQVLSSATSERHQARKATHVIAWPLVHPAGKLSGMICLELNSPAHAGLVEQWEQPIFSVARLVKISQLTLLTLGGSTTPSQPIGASPDDLPYVKLFAIQPETVLITGKTGTGKSYLAKQIHEKSLNREGPMITYSIIGLSAEMQLAHLFGWKRGAFTGASENNPGLIQAAQGGTLFIDEVDKLGREAQAGLLEMLQERSYLRLGDNQRQLVNNVRFIAASNADLTNLIKDGTFREDLYYRLNVLPIKLPELGTGNSSIDNSTRLLLSKINSERNAPKKLEISDNAIERLTSVRWPGNLRQLDNVLKRAIVFCESKNLLCVGKEDVEYALELEAQPSTPSSNNLLEAMLDWNRSLLSLAEEDPQRFESMLTSIRSNIGFASLWYVALASHDNNHKLVASMIGKEASYQSRNYKKELKRELRKLRLAYRALDLKPPDRLIELSN